MTTPKGTGGVMVSRMVNTVEDGVRLEVEQMTEPMFQDRSNPEVYRPLRLIAQHLLDNPDELPPSLWTPHLRAILQEFVADHPRRKLGAADIGDLVGLLRIKRPGQQQMSLPDARKIVARATERNFLAVKQDHIRSRKPKPRGGKLKALKREA